MKNLGQFQIKSLSNFCLDLAKAWFAAGVIAPMSVASAPWSNRVFLIIVGIGGCWSFVLLGLWFGKEVKHG